MTNEEINLKLAAILGWVFIPPEEGHYGKMTYPKWRHPGGGEYVSEIPPPYATDWRWCGPLVEKYGIKLDWSGESLSAAVWSGDFFIGPHFHYYDYVEAFSLDEPTPQRAICLAVIAAQPILATLPPEAPIHDNDRS